MLYVSVDIAAPIESYATDRFDPPRVVYDKCFSGCLFFLTGWFRFVRETAHSWTVIEHSRVYRVIFKIKKNAVFIVLARPSKPRCRLTTYLMGLILRPLESIKLVWLRLFWQSYSRVLCPLESKGPLYAYIIHNPCITYIYIQYIF